MLIFQGFIQEKVLHLATSSSLYYKESVYTFIPELSFISYEVI